MFNDAYPVWWAGRQAVVVLPEQIDLSNAGQIREELLSVINRGAARLIADMTATMSCDHAGTDALARAHHRAIASGTELRLVVTARIVRRILAVSGLDRLVSIYPSLEAAAAAAGPSQVSEDLLGRIVRDLLHAGLILQAALDSACEADRQYIAQAQQHIDETIRDIRNHVFITRRLEFPPSSEPPDGAQ